MKELSIEDKAKRYDEVVAMAKECITYIPDEAVNKYMLGMFPELRESEDEKIRKALITFFQRFPYDSIDNAGTKAEAAVAWLEKQSNKPQGESTLETVKDEKVENANKVEPKFKVGDWIISYNEKSTYQVTEVQRGIYVIRDNAANKEYCIGIEQCDKSGRLWTIADAKAGDILHATGFCNDCIFIFNRLDNWKFDAEGDRAVATGYCCLFVASDEMEFGIQGPDCIEVNTVKPATKEQRDLLFSKMHEAGYEWDEKKLELKKKFK